MPRKEDTRSYRYTVGIPEGQDQVLREFKEFYGFNSIAETIRHLVNRGIATELPVLSVREQSKTPEMLRQILVAASEDEEPSK